MQYDSIATANSLHLAKNLTAQYAHAEILNRLLGDAMKLRDYSPTGKIQSLQMLGVCRYQTSCDSRKMKMQSDAFLAGLPDLRYLDLQDVVIKERAFLSPESVSAMDFARFSAE